MFSGTVDFIHNHSLWMMPNVYAGWVSRHGRGRQMVSPRGTLSARAREVNALQKKMFWHFLHAPALREAVCFHATGDSEYEDIRRFIYELETAPEFILIEEVVLSQGDESEEALVLTLGVSTYYLAGPDAAS